MMTTMRAETPEGALVEIMCFNCSQLIARRRHNHIDPIGAELTLDSKGRPVIVCPKCGRFTVVKRTVKDGE